MKSIIRKIGFLSAFIIPALVLWGSIMGGYFHWSAVVFVFVFIPLTDFIIGRDTENVNPSKLQKVATEAYYQVVLYIWSFVQIAFLIYCSYIIATQQMYLYELIGFTIGVALVTGGIGITVAHELGHKKSEFERILSQLLLMTVYYMHFYIEHNKGHHVHVSTPKDPATARDGENFYQFWWRSVSEGIKSAWNIERARINKSAQKSLIHNKMIWYAFLPPLFFGLIFIWISLFIGSWAWQIIPFLLIQSVLGFSLLEAVNYLEHYGLMRNQKADGSYERVLPKHSWNNSHMFSNLFLFQLQRHSDHHFNAIKRYQVLNHIDQAPQLPAGYPSMILVAIVPPLWFKIMNPKLDEWKKIENELVLKNA